MARLFSATTATRPESFAETVAFAREHALYIAAFNHLTPFPGTPLYTRLQNEGRLLYENWWLDERYSYNRIPFQPRGMTPELLQQNCLAARREFYSWPSIAQRGFARVNRSNWFMWRNFYLINALHRNDVSLRDHYPLGDESWQGTTLDRELMTARTRSHPVCARHAGRRRGHPPPAARKSDARPDRALARTRAGLFCGRRFAGETVKQTIVANEGGRVVCVGSCAIRERFVNGQPYRVGYLGGLRLDAPVKPDAIDILRRGYEFFRELQTDKPADFYFTSIAADNAPARKFLERGLPGMPATNSSANS